MNIDISLSVKGIQKAVDELRAYKKELPQKINALIDKMVAYGEEYAIKAVEGVDENIPVTGYRKGNEGFIVASGNAVWVEFGTGVKYNGEVGSSPHPKGEELGMLIGKYGKGHGADPNGWYFPTETGGWGHTYGEPAHMFVYKTAQAIKEVFPDLAKEVFND